MWVPNACFAGSVDGFIGKPRAIFCDSGCGSEGNPILGLGNPAASVDLKRYLKTIRLEQSLTAVTPKQAKPVFSDKLSLMSRHISFRLKKPKKLSGSEISIQNRLDIFNLLAITGDGAGDLGNLLFNQISYLPDNSGLYFYTTCEKISNLLEPREVFIFHAP